MPGRRLYRSTTDSKIAGVCGGIAEYFDIDPVFVRIAAILLVFANGLGLIAYVICWIAVPQGETRPGGAPRPDAGDPAPSGMEPPAASPPRRTASPGSIELVGGAALITVGFLFLLLNLGVLDWDIFHFWRWRVVWPLVLIGLGIYIVSISLKTRTGSADRRS